MSIRTAIRDWLNAPSYEEGRRESEAQDLAKRAAFNAVYHSDWQNWRLWSHCPPDAHIWVEIISPQDPTTRILSGRESPSVIDGVYWRVARHISRWRDDLGQAPLGGVEDQSPHLVSPRGRTTEAGGGR